MGSAASTAQEVIAEMEREGKRVSLLRIRMFRPFPSDLIRDMLRGIRKAAVMDRGFAVGTGGILSQEVRAALFGMDQPPLLYPFVAGLGGMDVTPEMIREMVSRCLQSGSEPEHVVWMGVER
jgi:pyruvate/2-oxoacid:ferredoxin oxidoreductase alpha subunit